MSTKTGNSKTTNPNGNGNKKNEDDGARNVKSFHQTEVDQDISKAPDESYSVTSFSVGSARELTAAQRKKVIGWYTQDGKKTSN